MNKNFQSQLHKETIFSIILLVALSALAYLPMINKFGYYFDDWNLIWAGYTQGAQKLVDIYSIDRPFVGYMFSGLYRLLGDSALPWNLSGYLVRLAGGFGLLWMLRMIWPKERQATFAIALLFLIYPGYLRQPNAIQYQNHLINYALAIFSIAFTVKAILCDRLWQKSLFYGLAMAFGLLSFLIMEYMIGLEGLRLLIIWYLTPSVKNEKITERIRRAFKRWIPYLLIIFGFLYWRAVIFKSSRPATDLDGMIQWYIQSPGYQLSRVGIELFKDFVETAFMGWIIPLYQYTVHARLREFILSAGFAALGALLLGAYFFWSKFQNIASSSEDTEKPRWDLSAIWIGGLTMLAASLPIIFSDRNAYFSSSLDRYTMPAAIGGCMLLVGLLSRFMSKKAFPWVVILLAGAAVMTHYHNNLYFADYWKYQRDFWWQMSWRVPQLEEDTVLMADLPGGFPIEEDYEVWGPAGLIYYPESTELKITAEVLNSNTAQRVIVGEGSSRNMRTIDVNRDFEKTLILSYPSTRSCLHVIDGNKRALSDQEPPIVQLIAPYSMIDRVQAGEPSREPPQSIFGAEPEHEWCYYYQKASLAEQRQDWEEAARLGDEAIALGHRPLDYSEWMPVLSGYVHTGRMDDSETRSLLAIIKETPLFEAKLCLELHNSDYDPTVKNFLDENLCNP